MKIYHTQFRNSVKLKTAISCLNVVPVRELKFILGCRELGSLLQKPVGLLSSPK